MFNLPCGTRRGGVRLGGEVAVPMLCSAKSCSAEGFEGVLLINYSHSV